MTQNKSGDGKKAEGISDDELDQVVGGNPVPYPDIGGGGGGKTVKVGSVSGGSKSSTGDEAGTTKGVVSGKTTGSTSYTTASTDVKAEGSPVSITGNPGMNND